jgi:hypothetical protein
MTDPATPRKRKKSQKRRRNDQIVTRCTTEESKAIADKASQAGLSLSAYARTSMLGDPGPSSKGRPSIEKELLLRTLGALAHLNHRADQIVRGNPTPDISEIRQIGNDFMLLRDAIFAALKKLKTKS